MVARRSGSAAKWSLESVYALYPILEERAKSSGGLLSGGEQQMLSIARALMTNPALVLMDEPSEGLSPLMVERVGRNILDIRRLGLSILLVEQNVTMALAVADYVYVINRGVVVHESPPDSLRRNTEVTARYLGVGTESR